MARAAHPCAETGCPTIVRDTPRCPPCTQTAEQRRGTRQQRGYDSRHDATRKQWAPVVAAGKATCWRCGTPLDPGLPWDMGHDDDDRSRHRGPECQPCNRATAVQPRR